MPAGSLSPGGRAQQIDGHYRADVKGTFVHLPVDDASERVTPQAIATGPTVTADATGAPSTGAARLVRENRTIGGIVAGFGARVIPIRADYDSFRHGRRRPANQVFAARDNKDVDGRAKPCHDDIGRDHRDLVLIINKRRYICDFQPQQRWH